MKAVNPTLHARGPAPKAIQLPIAAKPANRTKTKRRATGLEEESHSRDLRQRQLLHHPAHAVVL
jgi:hypothetical protein